jgi:hypothetical protein
LVFGFRLHGAAMTKRYEKATAPSRYGRWCFSFFFRPQGLGVRVNERIVDSWLSDATRNPSLFRSHWNLFCRHDDGCKRVEDDAGAFGPEELLLQRTVVSV